MLSSPQTQRLDAGHAVEAAPSQPAEGWVERLCRWLCELAIMSMMVMVAAEVLLRNLFGVSLQSADELGGYLLVAVSFLSLSTCFVSGAFHKVEFIDNRLGERGHALRKLIFDAIALAFSLLLLWQLVRLVLRSFDGGDFAATILGTPLWIPQLTMPVGIAALCYSLLRAIGADIRGLSAASRRSRGQ
ncbi:TRAP transporter small permease [Bradyrhizobium sp. OK095]|uniref:TRAP transporter small permease n=1 Tax=Bradyrhizobium sp. OK095 TaxID=1882760 RepID=UPI0008D8D1D0|nr:TRAP transporter small permease [Bradyrhizobium sp. OK095]SEM45497.1 TRAP-type C4-dicarboxylate transport system, small permease component [Bradyrhizobium sp. OK095]